jgi:DNA-binding CsgD family transcriptional regulator
MCIELSTLKTHINKIYKKTGVKNRQQLMVRSKRLGN